MEWICYPIFDADDHAYDTSSVVHLRSSPDLTPDAILLRLFRNAHHPDSLSAQLTVVWWLLPEAATGGPSSISIAVTSRPTLLSCHTRSGREGLPSSPSRRGRYRPQPSVESTKGTSPSAAHGTGLESLPSSGSSYPTAGSMPIRQCAINIGTLCAIRPKQRAARTLCPRNFLYLPIAHLTSVVST